MTLDDTRNAMAEMMGAVKTRVENNTGFGCPVYYCYFLDGRSIEVPASLDWLVRAWPEGWQWFRGFQVVRGLGYSAHRNNAPSIVDWQSDTGDELLDRFTLLYKVAEWLRDNDRPAFDKLMEKWRKLV